VGVCAGRDEREGGSVCVCGSVRAYVEREREGERESVCVCVRAVRNTNQTQDLDECNAGFDNWYHHINKFIDAHTHT
jgi:hypothetical protein